jgi:hypothetical protein
MRTLNAVLTNAMFTSTSHNAHNALWGIDGCSVKDGTTMRTLNAVLTNAMRIADVIEFIVVAVRHRTHRETDSPLCSL